MYKHNSNFLWRKEFPRRFSARAVARIKCRGARRRNPQVRRRSAESAGCSKIHELSDRVRLSGVCSVKLALAHRITPNRATAVAVVPRDEGLFWSIARTNRISDFASHRRWQIRPSLFSCAEPRAKELRIIARGNCLALSLVPVLRRASSNKLGAFLFHYFSLRKVSG